MISKEKAKEKIMTRIAELEFLLKIEWGSPQFKRWIRDTQVALEYIFGKTSRHITDFNQIRYSVRAFSESSPSIEPQEAYVLGLENAKAVLISMVDEVQEYWDASEITLKKTVDAQKIPTTIPSTNKIFVIHGHDSGTKETVARFLMQVGIQPIILHEQVNKGKTIIEKFEEYSDVSYAIALLTPDDIGASEKEPENFGKRARQNVIFEFGYFMGRIGRHKVVGLIKGDVEVPSDYSGVLYIPIDESGAWKFRLIKELKSVGFEIDANKAI